MSRIEYRQLIMSSTIKTHFIEGVIQPSVASMAYDYLKTQIPWQEGIRSKKGFTRKAYALQVGDLDLVDDLIATALSSITSQSYNVLGIYLNYYEHGEHYTPNHRHIDTHQLVISLGASRTLMIGKKPYVMNHGDAIVFGSSLHGLPKDPTVHEGRISIATFMVPV